MNERDMKSPLAGAKPAAPTLHPGVTVVPPKISGNSTLGGPYGAAGAQAAQINPPLPPSQGPSVSHHPPGGFAPSGANPSAEANGAKPPGAGGVFGGQAFKDVAANKFMSKFVAGKISM